MFREQSNYWASLPQEIAVCSFKSEQRFASLSAIRIPYNTGVLLTPDSTAVVVSYRGYSADHVIPEKFLLRYEGKSLLETTDVYDCGVLTWVMPHGEKIMIHAQGVQIVDSLISVLGNKKEHTFFSHADVMLSYNPSFIAAAVSYELYMKHVLLGQCFRSFRRQWVHPKTLIQL